MILNTRPSGTDEPVVVLTLPKSHAEWVRDGLADVACWISGFKAGLGPDRSDDAPLGHQEIRELNIALKQAIEESK